MDNENKIEYYKRDFLNTSSKGMAAFEASVDYEGGRHSYVSGSFAITDCNRKVSLDFDAWDVKDRQNAKDKVRRLIEELQEFEKKLLEGIQMSEENDAAEAEKKRLAETEVE